MNNLIRFVFSATFVFALLFNSFPVAYACGPSYLTPVFDYTRAPEFPYTDYANGKLGIVKPTYPRVVLFAAYRYLNGGGFSSSEQKGLIEVWDAYFRNKDFNDNNNDEALKAWIEKRKSVFPEEKNPPEIYVERPYGGYDFFPNCNKNAFEVATETLSDRLTSYGSDSEDIKNWTQAQDQVFENCASGKKTPEAPNPSMAEWLQKDRKYQIAAAEFYSLNYSQAKEHFTEIAEDSDSPWQEVSKYLIGRTLIRQASLTRNSSLANTSYIEAEQHLHEVSSGGGKYADSAEKLIGLIKYRLRPEERVQELAQNLSGYGDDNFRQELIDYTWLLDKFEAQALTAEENRKKKEAALVTASQNNNSDSLDKIKVAVGDVKDAGDDNSDTDPEDDNKLTIRIYNDDYSQSWVIKLPIEATDDDAISAAESVIGVLSDKMKDRVRESRQSAYQLRFSKTLENMYQANYYGEEETTLEILPAFLRNDDLSDWLFTFQIDGNNAYQYSLSKYQQNTSDLWLMTALSKATTSSPQVSDLLEAAARVGEPSPAFPTISYHRARIMLEQGKTAETRKLLDEILNSGIDLPLSARNKFLELRMGLSENLEDFLKFSLRKPFTFNMDGLSISIEEEIARQKTYYDPKYNKESRAEYEREIEENFKEVRKLEGELMLDDKTVDIINQNFPITLLVEIQKSQHFPEYLKTRLAQVIWTRAILLEKYDLADKILPVLMNDSDDSKQLFNKYKTAKTISAKRNEAIYIILKNEDLTPYLAAGFGNSTNNYSGGSKWWCVLEDEEWDDSLNKLVPRKNTKPGFLSENERNLTQAELKKLKNIGEASGFLTTKVLEWAARSPRDPRIPESLYIAYEANGWDKYGCGGNFERRNKIGNYLKRNYPNSKWTQSAIESEN